MALGAQQKSHIHTSIMPLVQWKREKPSSWRSLSSPFSGHQAAQIGVRTPTPNKETVNLIKRSFRFPRLGTLLHKRREPSESRESKENLRGISNPIRPSAKRRKDYIWRHGTSLFIAVKVKLCDSSVILVLHIKFKLRGTIIKTEGLF